MTTWITIKVDDLYTYLVATQVDILRKCALAKNQGDPVVEVIRDISLKIRAQIANNRKNALSQQPYTIPPELKSEACILILEVAQTRIPGLKLTTDQIRLADQARLQLQKVVSGEIVVSMPEGHVVEVQKSIEKSIEVVCHRPKIATNQHLKGF
ncbi:MAG: hypothetical protein LBH08_01375 [Puniceicoccales bacterium]|jgi:hypothetical protein|nr:hypothetical protein [Puniceicoccales bacterium]